MTADNPQDFDYERMAEPGDASTRQGYWNVAKGLQEVDGLRTSAYLDGVAAKHVAGEYSIAEAGAELRAYYADRAANRGRGEAADAAEAGGEAEVSGATDAGSAAEVSGATDASNAGGGELNREREADLVSCRIVELLGRRAFELSPSIMAFIHRALFQDLDPGVYRPGAYKTDALVKSEFILNGDSVLYADPSLVAQSLAYLFEQERGYVYGIGFDAPQMAHFAEFVAHLWQVHPFVEGNTRTVAVFSALYLDHLGFDADNAPFEKRARYFRDALVRANYRNAKAGILPDLAYLERFFENMLSDADHELRSRDLICQALFDDPTLLRNVSPEWAIEK